MTLSGGPTSESNAAIPDLVDVMKVFRARFETLHPVKLQRASLGGHFGDTGIVTRKGRQFLLVRVERSLSEEAQLLVLIHELAHCLQWRVDRQEAGRESDHDAEWGLAYARAWRGLLDST